MAFRRTLARSLWAAKNANAAACPAAVPKPPVHVPPARRPLPAVDDCPTLAYLRPRPATVRYTTASVPLPAHCFPALPVGDQLFNRLRLDGLVPPTAVTRPPEKETGVTVEEARKVARAAEMEVARARLRSNAQSVVSGSEFAALCVDIAGGAEGGRRLARALDDSGVVIVLGDAVFLRPDMVAKAIGSMIPATTQAAQAASAVDLSWDVMEPVCFYVTSLYFMSGYAFFMRTATEPSFEGFYRSRLASRQRRLMRSRRFEIARYEALKRQVGARHGCSVAAAHGDCAERDAIVLRQHVAHVH
ncbi:hypothetical protein E2562_015297 [Oryza meyeriana var. granulata]|uniref:Calcium uniporter protein C-terminal domain-containing protein n=1 Tax=Oryza meyeriana var. granulata TaxID=110450 RepID=A0A6G1DLM6_9ORYZ|nr:hypothetical protein E2562_015297 [Oryza meyeriana var. granulata]